MKKNSFSNVVKTSLLFVGISLLLWNCRKQEFHEGVVFENFSSAYKQRTISLSELADVKKYIDEINSSNEVGKTSEIEGAIFDQDNVIEVIDTIQNTNYSLRFTYPDTPAGEFYNLIIGRTPEGELTTPFVLKYVCDEDFVDNYIANDFDIHYFKGVIKLHTYTDFFSLGAFSKTTDCPPEHDDVGDPIECEEQPLDGSSMTGGGSNNGDNNGNPYSGNNSGISFGGAGSPCSFRVTDNGPCAEGGTAIHPPSACGAGTGVQHVLIIECATESKTTTTNDCPSCATTNPVGGIGLNQPSIGRMRVDLIRRLQMNDSNQINWVNDDMNNQNVIDIISFLNLHKPLDGNDDTPYAINFAQSAVEALVNNGEVDFLEKIILDGDLKENDCLYSVYTDMGKATTFANYLENFDGDMSVANLRLKYDEDFESNHPDYTSALAITLPPQNYLIDIIFNGDENLDVSIHDKPKLIIALCFIHEMIHAEIYRKMLSAAQLGNLNSNGWTIQQQIDFVNNLRNDFPGLYDYYYQRWHPDWGHQIMAQHYLNIIVSALSEYDNNQNSLETYEALAWIGLYDTISWNNLPPQQQQNHITNRQNFENNATDICN